MKRATPGERLTLMNPADAATLAEGDVLFGKMVVVRIERGDGPFNAGVVVVRPQTRWERALTCARGYAWLGRCRVSSALTGLGRSLARLFRGP